MEAKKENGFLSRVNAFFGGNKEEKKLNPVADFKGTGSGSYNYLFAVSYNGEKNLGEIGPIKNYVLDYALLRMRSWQSYHESEITQTIMNRYNMWLIGKGLKLQAEPDESLLQAAGVDIDLNKFSKIVEARFAVWAKSKYSDFSGMKNLHKIAATAVKNALLGGDVLCILRFDGKAVNVQLIDGAHVQSPMFGSEWWPETLANGNRILNGIEMDERGQHVAYYVRQADFTFQRIEAKGKSSGLQQAFLVYGLEYRLDNVRGVPLFAVVLETLKKLERYKEATVGSAEERQKIIMQIVHGLGSTGENPQNKNLAKAFDISNGIEGKLPVTDDGKVLANTIAVSTNKQVYNMPIDAELKPLESKSELHFKDFYTVNFDIVCGAVSIPPNVASSKYDSNFSAARAAIKDWEHTLIVKRDDISFQFYQPIYNFWLECEILLNRINAPGYLEAQAKGDIFLVETYRTARFIGAAVPHIDPLKEVKAEREKLGSAGMAIPLTTAEAATENLGSGEYEHNVAQFEKELADSISKKIIAPEKTQVETVPGV